ncbi:UNVERIFIED_CONTAM: hypothetical protein RMT77_002375 [Armadillidium vulgare]
MSLENPVALNTTESTDYSNELKEETGLANTRSLNKCEMSEKICENLTLSSEHDSVTKDASSKEVFSNKEQFVNSSVNEIENFNDDSNFSNASSKSLSEKHITTLDSENSLNNKNKNDLNGKEYSDTISTNNSDTVKNHKVGGLTNLSENNKDNIHMDSAKPFCKNDNVDTESDGAKLPQKINDTNTGDILVGKRKRENTADEDLRKKQLKIETKVEEKKTEEKIKSLTKNNTERLIEMESEELDELEKEIFDSNGEISDTQDEDTVMKDLTVQPVSTQQKSELEHDLHSKDIKAANQDECLGNHSQSSSQNARDSLENNLLSENRAESIEKSSVRDSEKCAVDKTEIIESLKELNGETNAETEENVNNVKDIECKISEVVGKSLDISKSVNKEPENKLPAKMPIEKETLKEDETISEKIAFEKDNNIPNNTDLENGSSYEENEELEDEIETQLNKNIVSSCEEKINEESSSESPECDSDNLKNCNEKTEEVASPLESIETSKETIINNVDSAQSSADTTSDNLEDSNENKKVGSPSDGIESVNKIVKNDEFDSVKSITKDNEMVKNDECESGQSTTKDAEENVGDIVIGEAFSINEEEMKAMDNADDDFDNSEISDAKKSEVSEEKKDESTPSVSSVGSPTASIDHDKPSGKKVPSKSGKKHKRSSLFSVGKKKKKTSGLPKVSPTLYVPPVKLELDLPSFLQELATIDSALHVVRERYDEEGKKFKVHCIVFHETVLDWAMSETLLSPLDNSKALRTRLKVKNRSHIYPENYDSKLNEIHPVLIGDKFPFAMPRGITGESVSDREEVPLPFPLENLYSLCPSASSYRTAGDGKKFNLKSISFAEEPLEWAFKETFLSSFEDSPILSNIFELDSSSKCWPDFADVILTHEGVNSTFPFACPNSKRYFENFLFSSLSPEIPLSLRHETLQFPSIRSDLERDLYGERDSLVRLLAVASFYKHSSCIPAVRTNRKLSVSHAALVSSFRPLIISQANKTSKILRDIRADLLKDVTCQDSSIIPCMINGPLHCKRGFIFSHLQRLEAAVAKDPNNKLQNI